MSSNRRSSRQAEKPAPLSCMAAVKNRKRRGTSTPEPKQASIASEQGSKASSLPQARSTNKTKADLVNDSPSSDDQTHDGQLKTDGPNRTPEGSSTPRKRQASAVKVSEKPRSTTRVTRSASRRTPGGSGTEQKRQSSTPAVSEQPKTTARITRSTSRRTPGGSGTVQKGQASASTVSEKPRASARITKSASRGTSANSAVEGRKDGKNNSTVKNIKDKRNLSLASQRGPTNTGIQTDDTTGPVPLQETPDGSPNLVSKRPSRRRRREAGVDEAKVPSIRYPVVLLSRLEDSREMHTEENSDESSRPAVQKNQDIRNVNDLSSDDTLPANLQKSNCESSESGPCDSGQWAVDNPDDEEVCDVGDSADDDDIEVVYERVNTATGRLGGRGEFSSNKESPEKAMDVSNQAAKNQALQSHEQSTPVDNIASKQTGGTQSSASQQTGSPLLNVPEIRILAPTPSPEETPVSDSPDEDGEHVATELLDSPTGTGTSTGEEGSASHDSDRSSPQGTDSVSGESASDSATPVTPWFDLYSSGEPWMADYIPGELTAVRYSQEPKYEPVHMDAGLRLALEGALREFWDNDDDFEEFPEDAWSDEEEGVTVANVYVWEDDDKAADFAVQFRAEQEKLAAAEQLLQDEDDAPDNQSSPNMDGDKDGNAG